jgi:hypothetical protein
LHHEAFIGYGIAAGFADPEFALLDPLQGSMDLPSESAVPIFNMPQYFPMMFQVSLVRFIHGPIGRGLDFRAGKLSLDGFMKAVKGSFKHFPEVTQCFLV